VIQSALSFPSFAKINWSLEVLGKRPDGYHELATVLQTISLHDELHFAPADDDRITLVCDSPDIPTDRNNLIVRAAEALQRRYASTQGAHISLEKRIPPKGGLGGASSNAAVTLVALAQLWKLPATAAVLLELAADLGADVPFFLLGGCVRATGIGTTLSPLVTSDAEPIQPLIVVTPKATVATPDAYAALRAPALTTSNAAPILSSSRRVENLRDSPPWTGRGFSPDDLKNDFESVIFDIEPEIRRAKESLLQAGALGALLAGSGSSVFGIFANREDQQQAANKIELEPGWRIFPCVTLSRKEYLRSLGSWDILFVRSFNSGSDIGA
jgi:4-diphosphocytidyl-2-C-methyl-D-erythritol kinase